MGGVWSARLAVVHGEGSQSRAVLRRYRRRPASAKAMRQRQLAIVGPQRVARDVGNHYRLLSVCCGAARTDAGSNPRAIDGAAVFGREAGGRCSAEGHTVGIKKKNRTQKASLLLLDFRTQCAQDF